MAAFGALALAACAPPPSMPQNGTVQCSSGTSAVIGGESIMGAGSDGMIADTDLVFSARVSPGAAGCTTIGAAVR